MSVGKEEEKRQEMVMGVRETVSGEVRIIEKDMKLSLSMDIIYWWMSHLFQFCQRQQMGLHLVLITSFFHLPDISQSYSISYVDVWNSLKMLNSLPWC